MILLGLDGEMSDSELDQGAVLIQIGLALSHTERFSSLIGWEPGTYHATDAGMAVHGITPEQIAAAPPAHDVDQAAEAWLRERLADRGYRGNTRRLVPVGWNVGAFDLPFVRTYLPRTNRLLSRRVVDLNAFVLTWALTNRPYDGEPRGWQDWKSMAEAAARRQLTAVGIETRWHDAEYDALAALEALAWLADPPPPQTPHNTIRTTTDSPAG